MTAVIVLLLTVLVVMGLRLRSESAALRAERQQNQLLAAKFALAAKSTNLDLEGRCADQAMKTWKTGGLDKLKNATYLSHYNQKLNKCLMRIENSFEDSGSTFASDRVVDAYEGRVYAELTWKLQDSGNAMSCKATLPTGEEVQCTSRKNSTRSSASTWTRDHKLGNSARTQLEFAVFQQASEGFRLGVGQPQHHFNLVARENRHISPIARRKLLAQLFPLVQNGFPIAVGFLLG